NAARELDAARSRDRKWSERHNFSAAGRPQPDRPGASRSLCAVPSERQGEPMTAATKLDRYELYEAAAQSPLMQAQFLAALVGERETGVTLGEDFCGSGAISRAWIEMHAHNRAICVDHDAEPLARLRSLAADPSRLAVHQQDVMSADDSCDVIAVLNFSIGEIHERRALVEYFRHVRTR